MPPNIKKFAGIAGLVGGLLYLAQNYTIQGLHHLRIEPLASQSEGLNGRGWSLFKNSQDSWPIGDNQRIPAASASQGTLGSSVGQDLDYPGSSSGSALKSLPPPTISSIPVSQPSLIADESANQTLRIASFNLQLFGKNKADNPWVMETIARILRQYDVIAVQEIYTRQQDLLPMLVDKINQAQRHFDYVIGPRVGRLENKEQLAFLFDTQTIETDRQQLYSVDDPQDLLLREPLVGWFRSKRLPAKLAFTFTLVNLHLDEQGSEQEIRLLPELVRSIHRDGREEDDVLLVGDFGFSDRGLPGLRAAGMLPGLEGVPTNLHGQAMLDNLLMPTQATVEFTGRSGVFDFLRHFNLSLDQAQQVSDHLPIWCEFSCHEGGRLAHLQP
jgi:deoxyribonuclease-1-like protein